MEVRPGDRGSRARRARGLALSTLVLVLMALVGELALRIAGYDPLRGALEGRDLLIRESDHPDLVYELTPSTSGAWGGVEVSVNSLGFRDREVSAQPQPGGRRVVVLGDSITMGWAFPLEATYPKVAEALLAGSEPPVEVLNLGVAGYGTTEEVAFFERVGRALDPDLVVVGFCVNDLVESSQLLNHVRDAQRHGALVRASRLCQWIVVHLGRASLRRDARRQTEDLRAEAQRAATEAEHLPEGDPALDHVRRLRAALEESDRQVAATGERNARREMFDAYLGPGRIARLRTSLEQLADTAATDGFDLALLFVPYLDQGKGGSLARANRIRFELVAGEAMRLGFDVIDPSREFRAVGLGRLRRRGDRVHPNPDGHAILGEALASYLREWAAR